MAPVPSPNDRRRELSYTHPAKCGAVMKRIPLLTTLFGLILLSGCIRYKQPTSAFTNVRRSTTNPAELELRERASRQGLYAVVPRDRRQIEWYDVPHWLTWTFFGNENDGIFGEDAKPPFTNQPGMKSFLAWQLRNPLDNFCFYVIGSADWETHHSFSIVHADAGGARYFKTEKRPSVFGNGRTAVIFALNDYKPFLSFKFPVTHDHQADFYLGWRPEGHFGIKCRPYKSIATPG